MRHELKVWPDQFAEILTGDKTHEFRRDDRDPAYSVDDELLLQEFEPAGERHTGRVLLVRITSLSRGPEWGIPYGYCAFSIARARSVVSDGDVRGLS